MGTALLAAEMLSMKSSYLCELKCAGIVCLQNMGQAIAAIEF